MAELCDDPLTSLLLLTGGEAEFGAGIAADVLVVPDTGGCCCLNRAFNWFIIPELRSESSSAGLESIDPIVDFSDMLELRRPVLEFAFAAATMACSDACAAAERSRSLTCSISAIRASRSVFC